MPLSSLMSLAGGLGGGAPDGPTSATSGTNTGNFQGGSLVVGAKQVGGKDNTAGGTSAGQAQTPFADAASMLPISSGLPPWAPWAIIGGGVILGILIVSRRK